MFADCFFKKIILPYDVMDFLDIQNGGLLLPLSTFFCEQYILHFIATVHSSFWRENFPAF